MVSERVVLLPGDGIGPEVAEEARLVLELLAPEVEIDERLIGGAAIRATGKPLPEDVLEACLAATAVTRSVSPLIAPVSSASGINCSGWMMPRVG